MKTAYHFVDANLGVEISSKSVVKNNDSVEHVWKVLLNVLLIVLLVKFWKMFCLREGKWHTLGKEGFAWGNRGREKICRLTIKWTSSKTVAKDFLYALSVPFTYCFKSIL